MKTIFGKEIALLRLLPVSHPSVYPHVGRRDADPNNGSRRPADVALNGGPFEGGLYIPLAPDGP